MKLFYECSCGNFIGHCDSSDNYLRHKDEAGNEMVVCLPNLPHHSMIQYFGNHAISIVSEAQLKLEGR